MRRAYDLPIDGEEKIGNVKIERCKGCHWLFYFLISDFRVYSTVIK